MNEESPFPLHRVIEAILFASQKPVSAKELTSICKGAAEAAKERPEVACFGKLKPEQIAEAIQTLEAEYTESGRPIEVRESAAGWQLVTKADFAPWLRQLFPENRSARLSAPALETLAIIAYRQPITRGDIEAVRGVAVDGVMQTLLDRGLVRIAGRAEIPGRPLLYETTQFFMEHFGLKDLDELPNAGELRRIALPTAPVPEAPAAAAPEADPQEPLLPEETAPDQPAASGEEVHVAEPESVPAEKDGPESAENPTS
jgi:segregation and condensation protein B